MIFSSLAFFAFFSVVLIFLRLVSSNRVKRGFLLAASYLFYGFWDWRFLGLMFVVTWANYVFGMRIAAQEAAGPRKRWMVGSLVFNLGVLAAFKYFNFFIDSANTLLASAGIRFGALDIILPVGISFIVFEVISYTIDIYRRELQPVRSLWELALLVAFFPHLVAGPILKPKHFLPQINGDIRVTAENLVVGGQIFLIGLLKKVLIADRLAMFVDPVFQNPQAYSTTTIWLAIFAYALQIYCDFSGYTDMAIGSARCMGFHIPQNFNLPYVSRSITEFWRRWHISLSSWLRDYLYISLGGNRKGAVRMYVNLMIVMLLGGLWHGASWNFVVWGALHGAALVLHKLWTDFGPSQALRGLRAWAVASWAMTFLFTCTAWVFFRAPDFDTAATILQKMYFAPDPTGINWYSTGFILAVPLMLGLEAVSKRAMAGEVLSLRRFSHVFALVFALLGLLLLAPQNSAPFIYFQF